MNGSEWLESLQENPSTERDNQILQAINDGLVVCTWGPITSSIQSPSREFHQATFQVCLDAAHVVLDDGSRFRFQVSAKLAQLCADALGGSLITSKISDLTYQQTENKLSVTTLPPGKDMVTTSKSKVWNSLVEKKRNGYEGFVRDCGKAWILSNQFALRQNMAINYGFYDPKAPYTGRRGLKMWQTIGTRHDSAHTDYSQTLIIMSSTCEVDGQEMAVDDVMKSRALCGLLSDEGVMKFTRQPGV